MVLHDSPQTLFPLTAAAPPPLLVSFERFKHLCLNICKSADPATFPLQRPFHRGISYMDEPLSKCVTPLV